MRGDEPLVRSHPGNFVPDGTPAREVPNVHAELDKDREDPELDVVLLAAPQPWQDPKPVRLTRRLRVGVGVGGDGRPRELLTFEQGTKFARDAEIVTALPDAFVKRGGR